MKKILALMLSAVMLLTSCKPVQLKPPEDIIQSSGQIVFNSDTDSSDAETDIERPDAEDDILGSSSVPSSSSAPSSAPPKSSSAPPPSSSSAPPSSSSVPPSSSKVSSSSEVEVSSSSQTSFVDDVKADSGSSKAPNDEVRAIWLSYLDFNTLLKNKTEKEFRNNMQRTFGKAVSDGFNTAFVQVRPFGDALYKSSFFPWSHTITGTEGEDPGFDPLKIIIECAKDNSISVEAWINPYRIRNSGTNADLDENNLAHDWLQEGTGEVIEYGNGLYFNPSNQFARDLIINGVNELVTKYSISGIHFDDYFYPTTDTAFDAADYKAYKNEGGKLALAAWRRDNVNKLVKAVYAEIKSIDKHVRFGISPQGNADLNYNDQYIDVEMWMKNPGYVDYICPQIYYGFENDTCPFSETVAYWNNIIKRNDIDLYVGLSASKIGTEDKWAGSGKSEWQESSDMLKRMVIQARRSSKYKGFAVFRLNSLYSPDSSVSARVAKEKTSLVGLLK